jgi:hypothetical protein
VAPCNTITTLDGGTLVHVNMCAISNSVPVEQLEDVMQGVSPGGQLAATTLTVLVAVAVAPWESVTENVTL